MFLRGFPEKNYFFLEFALAREKPEIGLDTFCAEIIQEIIRFDKR